MSSYRNLASKWRWFLQLLGQGWRVHRNRENGRMTRERWQQLTAGVTEWQSVQLEPDSSQCALQKAVPAPANRTAEKTVIQTPLEKTRECYKQIIETPIFQPVVDSQLKIQAVTKPSDLSANLQPDLGGKDEPGTDVAPDRATAKHTGNKGRNAVVQSNTPFSTRPGTRKSIGNREPGREQFGNTELDYHQAWPKALPRIVVSQAEGTVNRRWTTGVDKRWAPLPAQSEPIPVSGLPASQRQQDWRR